MTTQQQIEHDLYRLVITRRSGEEILCLSDGPHCLLPTVEIPRWQRVAEEINDAVKKRWQLEADCLLSLPRAEPSEKLPLVSYQVMECTRSNGHTPDGLCWIPQSNLKENSFRDPQSSAAVESALARIRAVSVDVSQEPFGKTGWLPDLCSWMQKAIDPIGPRLSGQFRQVTAAAAFSLMRFETNGIALWFKAVGEPNTHEFQVVSRLSALFPSFLPAVVAFRPEWNAWLMLEAKGQSPSEPSEWRTAARRLADL